MNNRIFLLFFTFYLVACGPKDKSQLTDLDKIEKLVPLDEKLGKPQPGEWLYHFKENGQLFEEYQTMAPVRPTKVQKIIYVQPLGAFTQEQETVIKLTRDYIELFFGLQTIIAPNLSNSIRLCCNGCVVSCFSQALAK